MARSFGMCPRDAAHPLGRLPSRPRTQLARPTLHKPIHGRECLNLCSASISAAPCDVPVMERQTQAQALDAWEVVTPENS